MREVNESGETDFHVFRRGYSKNGESSGLKGSTQVAEDPN
ncbi:hypothetical protein ACZ87_02496, partial [Candidatus Erwinia dacicola]